MKTFASSSLMRAACNLPRSVHSESKPKILESLPSSVGEFQTEIQTENQTEIQTENQTENQTEIQNSENILANYFHRLCNQTFSDKFPYQFLVVLSLFLLRVSELSLT